MLAATWPALAACQENAPPGPVPVPDHVLVRQTVDDCLTEPLDADGLVDLLAEIEAGRVAVHFAESAEPSPLAHGILTGKPFTFLDGAPLEERRTRAVAVPRGLGVLGPDGLPPGLPVPPGELAAFEPAAEAEVLDQVRPAPRDADELHDLLLSLVLCRRGAPTGAPGSPNWWPTVGPDWWAATGPPPSGGPRRELVHASLSDPMVDADEALAECVGGHLDLAGPVTVERLVDEAALPSGGVRGVPVTVARARSGLARRQAVGSAIELPDGRWCARHLLVRIHAASRSRRRRRVEAVPLATYVRFLACWQHLAPGTRAEGRAGLLSVIEQLQGIEAPAGEWERHLLPARVAGYDPRWLDELCLAGQVAWGRLTPRPDARDRGDEPGHRGTATPSPATPLALVCREDLGGRWPPCGRAARWSSRRSGRRPTCWPCSGPAAPPSDRSSPGPPGGSAADVDEGLWDLVSRGIVTADAFSAVRSLLAARARRRGPGRAAARPVRARAGPHASGERHRRGSVVAPARAGRPPAPGSRPGIRGAGRGRGLAAAGPLGRRGVGGVGAGVLPGPVARRGAGPAPARGPGPGAGRPVRGRDVR